MYIYIYILHIIHVIHIDNNMQETKENLIEHDHLPTLATFRPALLPRPLRSRCKAYGMLRRDLNIKHGEKMKIMGSISTRTFGCD